MQYRAYATIILFFLVLNCHALEKKDSTFKWSSNNVFKYNAVGFIFNFQAFTYERVINDRFSALISYGNGRGKSISDETNQYNGLYYQYTVQHIKLKSDLSFEFRYFLSYKSRKIPAGFHIGPSINFVNISNESIHYENYKNQISEMNRTNGNYKVTSVNINFGPQLLIKKIIAIDFMIAPGYGFLTSSEVTNSKTQDYKVSGFTLRYGVFIGFAIGK